ncbi:FecR domain-containing protein [Chitinophaga pollutisoli]|uniref:FecR domain-containing protein n=1 Tax=Chitinophaga pollutisoli TaxID=3133966 RepID=A0ABZ2YIS0_9BACT
MHKDELIALSAKITDGTATDEEIVRFNAYYDALLATGGDVPGYPDEEALLQGIRGRTKPAGTIRLTWIKAAAAAAVLFGIVTGAWMVTRKDAPSIAETHQQQPDVKPGTNSAFLTLADGRRISLDDVQPGDVASQGNIKITKTDKGEVVYEAQPSADDAGKAASWNELSTPRGGQFRLLLPDGTKVWLNAASSLRFPATFTERERLVVLSGEGYFEVATDKKKPFVVQSASQRVKVLGTHFNIQAYTEEPLAKTSLLEGSVEVTAGAVSTKLSPGEQSRYNSKTMRIEAGPADVSAAAAWKNGYFVFNDTYLSDVIRQLSRWYDVQADFSSLPPIRYTGTIPRTVPLSSALKMLEITGNVQFEVNQNTIYAR